MPARGPVDQQQGRICVGQVAGPRGLKGEFFVRAFTADPHAIGDYGPLSNETGDRLLQVRVLGATKSGLVVRAQGIDDRSAAEALRGTRLFVKREALPPPAEDEFYHADLIGLQAELADDDDGSPRRIGRVGAVHDFGAAPVLEIERASAPALMIPFTKEAVPEVNLDLGRLRIAAIPGLLADDGEPAISADEFEP
jgi:16S rRNA processing protein RimM